MGIRTLLSCASLMARLSALNLLELEAEVAELAYELDHCNSWGSALRDQSQKYPGAFLRMKGYNNVNIAAMKIREDQICSLYNGTGFPDELDTTGGAAVAGAAGLSQ
ncbi:hypothetical protein C8J56DRAFT_891999 [Mycena floridula]|nr:hypothetical protein C8J56DRAFT_891999 [Mycena floridula]